MDPQQPNRPGRTASDRDGRRNWLIGGLAALVVVLIAVVVVIAVSDSDDDKAAPPTTTTTVATTTTTAPATTTTAPLPTTPEGYAQTLFTAWQTDNRTLAAQVASPEAVTSLFANPFPQATGGASPFSYQGCQGAAGSVICQWNGRDANLVMTVRNLTGGLPILVVQVQFQENTTSTT